jgi:hypothetical protein
MRAIDLLGGTEIVAEDDCWEFLRSEVIGRVAVVIDGRVDIFPVNYGLDGEGIVFRTNAGRKMEGIAEGEVAFEVDSIDRGAKAGWSVVVHGEARDITRFDGPERQRAAEPWTGRKDFLVRISPRAITGRRVVPASPTKSRLAGPAAEKDAGRA